MFEIQHALDANTANNGETPVLLDDSNDISDAVVKLAIPNVGIMSYFK